MSRKFIVGGNWKCNPKTYKECNELLKAWKKALPNVDRSKVEVVICPPALWLTSFTESFEGLGFGVCAQNCGKTDAGAFTGEWTAANLVDLGLKWTLLGHSERRSLYGETDEDVAEKVGKCQEAGLGVILCIGEKLEEREGGKTDEVNKRQLGACLPKIKDWDKIVIAYEPVWAIGTGKVATPEQAEETQKAIRAYLSQAVSSAVAEKVRIQYGGSVNPENCAELIKQPNIDGFLVGGASLKPSFMDIISAVGPSKMVEVWPAYASKMEKEGCNQAAIDAFKYNFGVLSSGADVMLPESKLDPVESLPTYEKLKVKPDARLLKKTLILKLNGGLGTGMGLDKAKSLLEAAVLDSGLYVLGGAGNANASNKPLALCTRWLEAPAGPSSVPSMSSGRCALAAVVLGAGLVATGGVGPQPDGCERFDAARRRWTPGPRMALGRCSHAAVACGGHVLVMGGLCHGRPSSSVECWSVGSKRWTTLPSMQMRRFAPCAAVLTAGKVYVCGGSDGAQSLSTVESYDFDAQKPSRWCTVSSLRVARHRA